MAKSAGIQTKYLTKAKLGKFTANRPHQNVVLKCGRLSYIDVRSMKDVIKNMDSEGGE